MVLGRTPTSHEVTAHSESGIYGVHHKLTFEGPEINPVHPELVDVPKIVIVTMDVGGLLREVEGTRAQYTKYEVFKATRPHPEEAGLLLEGILPEAPKSQAKVAALAYKLAIIGDAEFDRNQSEAAMLEEISIQIRGGLVGPEDMRQLRGVLEQIRQVAVI